MTQVIVVPWLSRVYVICTLSAVLCVPSGFALGNTYNCTRDTNHIQPRSHGTADLYHSAAILLSIMCSQFWKGHYSCHGALIYPRVYSLPLTFSTPRTTYRPTLAGHISPLLTLRVDHTRLRMDGYVTKKNLYKHQLGLIWLLGKQNAIHSATPSMDYGHPNPWRSAKASFQQL